MTSRLGVALLLALSPLVVASRAPGVPRTAGLDGSWTGRVVVGHRRRAIAAAATLGQAGAGVSGVVSLTGDDGSETFAVTGSSGAGQARLAGVLGGRRFLWRGHWRPRHQAWRGRVRVRESGHTMRGRLTFTRAGGPATECGADLFAQELMPKVFGPICAQCHAPGGVAQATRLHVIAGDPSATAGSAITLVDLDNPGQSWLLLKPRGELPHGGGRRLVAGSPEDQALLEWITLVTACGTAGGGGGGGGTGDLYLDNCASCHGADARGLEGRPDIHCSRSIHDVVRNGRKGPAGEMPAFPNLGDADIATLQSFLLGLCPTTSVTGSELYASNCASCHGAAATGAPPAPNVRCATRAPDAIRKGRGASMPSFPALPDSEVALLDAYFVDLCTQAGRPGADLYLGNCATCHGAGAGGGRSALGVDGPDIRCNRAIHGPVRDGNDDMPAFPGLSDPDIARIQQYLATSACPANATGADLYAGNCVACHGADARGVDGLPNIRCNRGIHDAVRDGRTGTLGTMPAFTAMSDAEIARVQGHLVGLCPPGSASGDDLYAGNCVSCHGTDAGGDGDTPIIRCATRVGDAVQEGRGALMPSFPALASADLAALTGFLDGLCTAHGRTGADLYAGNCATCHGATANGGRNGLGEPGPEIQCTGANDYQEKVRQGDDGMPAFPALGPGDVTAIVDFVHGAFCAD